MNDEAYSSQIVSQIKDPNSALADWLESTTLFLLPTTAYRTYDMSEKR